MGTPNLEQFRALLGLLLVICAGYLGCGTTTPPGGGAGSARGGGIGGGSSSDPGNGVAESPLKAGQYVGRVFCFNEAFYGSFSSDFEQNVLIGTDGIPVATWCEDLSPPNTTWQVSNSEVTPIENGVEGACHARETQGYAERTPAEGDLSLRLTYNTDQSINYLQIFEWHFALVHGETELPMSHKGTCTGTLTR